ncbi:hypothetical protein PENTCL1PPCAC_29354, partial [Pristionchus entomophagus]
AGTMPRIPPLNMYPKYYCGEVSVYVVRHQSRSYEGRTPLLTQRCFHLSIKNNNNVHHRCMNFLRNRPTLTL